MDFSLPPELVELQAEAGALGEGSSTNADLLENSWIIGHDREFSLELGRRGWLGMTWPTEVGGRSRPALERFVVFEQLIGAGAPVSSSWFADRQIGPALLQFGTEQQRKRWLPGIISGAEMWCIGMSEPDAGSDVA